MRSRRGTRASGTAAETTVAERVRRTRIDETQYTTCSRDGMNRKGGGGVDVGWLRVARCVGCWPRAISIVSVRRPSVFQSHATPTLSPADTTAALRSIARAMDHSPVARPGVAPFAPSAPPAGRGGGRRHVLLAFIVVLSRAAVERRARRIRAGRWGRGGGSPPRWRWRARLPRQRGGGGGGGRRWGQWRRHGVRRGRREPWRALLEPRERHDSYFLVVKGPDPYAPRHL